MELIVCRETSSAWPSSAWDSPFAVRRSRTSLRTGRTPPVKLACHTVILAGLPPSVKRTCHRPILALTRTGHAGTLGGRGHLGGVRGEPARSGYGRARAAVPVRGGTGVPG